MHRPTQQPLNARVVGQFRRGLGPQGLRLFQQTIFGQDLMLLSNEIPKKMPLDSRFEIPVRADAMSMAYRRWLDQRGVRYGTYRELESPAMPAPAGHLPTGEIA